MSNATIEIVDIGDGLLTMMPDGNIEVVIMLRRDDAPKYGAVSIPYGGKSEVEYLRDFIHRMNAIFKEMNELE